MLEVIIVHFMIPDQKRLLMRKRWADYLFAVAVRFICGAVASALLSIVVIFFGGKARGKRTSLLIEWINTENHMALALWFGAWAFVGGFLAVRALPAWKTPWYKHERWDAEFDDGQGNQIRIIEDE